MRKTVLTVISIAAVIASGMASARPGDRLRERLKERRAESGQQHVSRSANAAARTIAYGSDPLQVIDFHTSKAASPAPLIMPLILFVHGGGWSKGSKDNATGRHKASHYNSLGYAFASMNYRLVPQATVEQQAQDIADAVKTMIAQADRLGIDRRKIVLMGHSAGAHLVALVGTDPRYLRAAGLSHADIAGVIPIDGACYDVPSQMTDGPKMMHDTYLQAFGSDPVRQRALSPTLQAAPSNVPAFYIPYVQREDGKRQSEALAAALRKAGTSAESQAFPGKGLMGHMEINRQMGDPSYAPTQAVDRWLAQLLGAPRKG